MISNKKFISVVNELFISGRKLHVHFLFITQSHFIVRKDVRLNVTPVFVMKIPNKRIAITHSSDIDFAGFKRLYRRFTAKPYSLLVIDTSPSSDDLFHFCKYPLEEV